MMSRSAASSRLRHTEPVYVEGTARGEVWAHFPSGSIVRALRDRTRAYPKLAGEAPPTRAIYGALTRLHPSAARVIDAGCGSGIGTLRLSEHFDTVVGIDCDLTAIAFAREYAPLATFETADVEALPRGEPGDALIVCDVLGHTKRPGAALRSLRSRLSADATVIVAEPTAHVSQHLRSPARRAFSRRALSSLLLCSGYEPTSFLGDAGTFLVCTARASASTAVQALAEGTKAREDGDLEAARSAYARAARGEDPRIRYEAKLGEAELDLLGFQRRRGCPCLLRGEGDRRPRSAASHGHRARVASCRRRSGRASVRLGGHRPRTDGFRRRVHRRTRRR